MRPEFSYRSLHGAPRARRRLLLATVLVLLVLALDVLLGGSLRDAVRGGATRVFGVTSSLRTSIHDTGYFVTHRSLARENARLRDQLMQHEGKSSGYDALKSENDALRALVSLREREAGVAVPVISSLRSSPYGTFVIGAGSAEGMEEGSLVLSDGGFVIGRITDLAEHTAMVTMIFASGNETEALVGSSPALVIGKGGGNAEAGIPRAAELPIETPVIAPSLGNRPIGTVGHVKSDAASAEQTAYIHIPINIAALRFVYVVTAVE